jgi:hypothetical protein
MNPSMLKEEIRSGLTMILFLQGVKISILENRSMTMKTQSFLCLVEAR